MREARAKHFEITMFYVGLGDPNLNIERVAIRVRNGGHHIPSKDILHRHHSSIKNLLNHLDLVNDLLVIDNSALNGEIVLEAENGRVKYQHAKLPEWVLPVRSQLLFP
jgi:predicted ABC-type ATPase